MSGFRRNDKGQMHTVEGMMAAVIMILVLVVVVKSTAITPLSSSSTNKHVQLELMNMGNDLLTSLDYDTTLGGMSTSPLKKSILDWDGSQFVLADGVTYQGTYAPTDVSLNGNQLAKALYFTFHQYGVAYNVEIFYMDDHGNVIPASNNQYVSDHPSMIWNGDPSDNAVTVSKVLAIHNTEISTYATNFYANTGIPAVAPTSSSDLYNLVIVKLTLWRM